MDTVLARNSQDALATGTAGRTYPPPPPGALVRLGATLVAAVSVLAGTAIVRMGLRRAPEGWRRTVGVLLRSESTRFALSAFGLRVPGGGADASESGALEERTARALRSFLSGEPDAHFCLEWRRPVTLRRRIAVVDLVVLRFGPDSRLEAITPCLAAHAAAAPPAGVEVRVHDAVVAAYNRTRHLPEVERIRLIEQSVRRALTSAGGDRQAALAYAKRLLTAGCLSFEPQDSTTPVQRFAPPAFASRRTLGAGYLSWIARTNDVGGSVDLWASAHHVGLDGVPLQDLLNRLERAWGRAEDVVFPPPTNGAVFTGPHACHAPGERAVDQLLTFVNLSTVLALRRELNRLHARAIGGEITLGALLAWLLTQEPEFRGVRIASTVDVAASGGYDRDVDVVSLRPSDFMTPDAPWGGLVEFAREFNRLIAAARTRTSPVRAGMQTAGLIPAWAHATVVRARPAALDETFGTLCITIVRDARVFVAPMTDLGLSHGFFAIGSANLPSAAGTRVTAVGIKGEAGRIGTYAAILHRVIERAGVLHGSVGQSTGTGVAGPGSTAG